MKIPTPWGAEDIAREQARRRELQRAETELLDREEKRLVAEAEREEQERQPPAETSAELPPAEVARRLELLEAQKPGPDGIRRDDRLDGRYRRRDRLRRVRLQKAAAEQDARDREHEKRVAKVTAKLEAQIGQAEAARTALIERHEEALAELDATLADCRYKLSELIRSLPPQESSEQRLERLELMRS